MKVNKYRAKKIYMYGEEFDSRKEFQRYCLLRSMEQAGEITDLRRQATFHLIPEQREESTEVFTKGPRKGQPKPGKIIEKACDYIADFTYVMDGKIVVEDVKGYRNPSSAGYAKFVIKRKLMLWIHGIRIMET